MSEAETSYRGYRHREDRAGLLLDTGTEANVNSVVNQAAARGDSERAAGEQETK